jgi:hypothetical protein
LVLSFPESPDLVGWGASALLLMDAVDFDSSFLSHLRVAAVIPSARVCRHKKAAYSSFLLYLRIQYRSFHGQSIGVCMIFTVEKY